MKRFRLSLLLSLGLILAACLLLAAAAGVHPSKRCYNADGEEIPCPSNYQQTQFAARATLRETGPTSPPHTAAPAASPTPTATLTSTAALTEPPAPTWTPVLAVLPPAPAASPPQVAPAPSLTSFVPLAILLGCIGLVVLILLVIVFRWLSGRRNAGKGS